MKRILIVASVISFIEWFNKENIEFLSRDMKCKVHIAVNADYMNDTDEESTLRYLERLHSENVTVHNIPFTRKPLSKENLAANKQLKNLISGTHFDLIHCHTPTVSMMTRIAAKKARKNGSIVMYTCHGFHFHNASSKKNWLIYYPIEKYLSRYCDYIVTINKEDFNRAKGFHCKNVKYIPGVGVNINKFKNIIINKEEYKSSLGVAPNSILLLSIGEMIERKNHKAIIKALARIKRNNIFYAIAGKGPLQEFLQSLATELGVGERVMFFGLS